MVLNVQRTLIAGNRRSQLVFNAVLSQMQAAGFCRRSYNCKRHFKVFKKVVISQRHISILIFNKLLLAATQEKITRPPRWNGDDV